jgi:hypothetical protein
MITALHTLVYADDPDAARAFFRDVLEFPCTDTGGGWLIFRTGPSELGVHPSSWVYDGQTGSTEQRFDVSLICVAHLRRPRQDDGGARLEGGRVHR